MWTPGLSLKLVHSSKYMFLFCQLQRVYLSKKWLLGHLISHFALFPASVSQLAVKEQSSSKTLQGSRKMSSTWLFHQPPHSMVLLILRQKRLCQASSRFIKSKSLYAETKWFQTSIPAILCLTSVLLEYVKLFGNHLVWRVFSKPRAKTCLLMHANLPGLPFVMTILAHFRYQQQDLGSSHLQPQVTGRLKSKSQTLLLEFSFGLK